MVNGVESHDQISQLTRGNQWAIIFDDNLRHSGAYKMGESVTPWWDLYDSPWFGIGAGVVIGAFGSLVSVKWLIATGWIIISIQILRSALFKTRSRKIIRKLGLSAAFGGIFFLGWRFIPKPNPPEPQITKQDLQDMGNEISGGIRKIDVPVGDAPKPATEDDLRRLLLQYKRDLIPAGGTNQPPKFSNQQLKAWVSGVCEQLKDHVEAFSKEDYGLERLIVQSTNDRDRQDAQRRREQFRNDFIADNKQLFAAATYLRATILGKLGRSSEITRDKWLDDDPDHLFGETLRHKLFDLQQMANSLQDE